MNFYFACVEHETEKAHRILKKIDSLWNHPNGFVDFKELSNKFKCRNKFISKSTKP